MSPKDDTRAVRKMIKVKNREHPAMSRVIDALG
jgi:hypothetical protein